MSSYLLSSIFVISLSHTISAQTCARWQNYPLNVCFKISRSGEAYSKQVGCNATDQTYTFYQYQGDACEGEYVSSWEAEQNCTETIDCFCESNIECDYATVYTEYSDPQTCSGNSWSQTPIILNKCVNNQLSRCTTFQNTSSLTTETCVNGTANGTIITPHVCDLQCPQVPCGRYNADALNTCAQLSQDGINTQSQKTTCIAPGSYDLSIYDNSECAGNATRQIKTQCAEGSQCICNNDKPCESARRRDDFSTNCTSTSGKYLDANIVLNVCLSSTLGLFPDDNIDLSISCSDGVLVKQSCGKDIDEGFVEELEACEVQCPIEPCDRIGMTPVNACLMDNTANSTYGSSAITCDAVDGTFTRTTYDDNYCQGNIVEQTDITSRCGGNTECICSNTQCTYAKFRYYFQANINDTCEGDSYTELAIVTSQCVVIPDTVRTNPDLYPILNPINSTNVQYQCVNDQFTMSNCGNTPNNAVDVCNVECIIEPQNITITTQAPISSTSIITTAEVSTQEPEPTCNRIAWRPTDVCLQTSKGNSVTSSIWTCDDTEQTYNVTQYDDDQCNGNIMNVTTDDCTDTQCICSLPNKPCDYAKFKLYLGTNETNGTNDTECEGDYDYLEMATVTNQCTSIEQNISYLFSCENDEVRVGECGDTFQQSQHVRRVFSTSACDTECIVAGITTTTETPQTTAAATTTATKTPETTPACLYKEGVDISGEFKVGFYFNCSQETIRINISYAAYQNNWFAILFTEQQANNNNAMYGDALIYTTGKQNERVAAEAGLYLYRLTEQNDAGVNYKGGENGERDWRNISTTFNDGVATLIYEQDLEKTSFDLNTESIPIRWAFGVDNDNYTLKQHESDAKATETMQVALDTVMEPEKGEDDDDDDDNQAGIIIGAVIGAFFAVMICFGIIWIIMDSRNRAKDQPSQGGSYGAVGADETDVEDVEMAGTR